MGTHTAWQALRQRPWRFLASPWPWRSLAYLLCGILPSGALAAAVLALLASRSSNAAPLVLPPVALALLLSGPAMARYEHWRLRLMQVDPAPGPYRRSEGAHRALQVGPDELALVLGTNLTGPWLFTNRLVQALIEDRARRTPSCRRQR